MLVIYFLSFSFFKDESIVHEIFNGGGSISPQGADVPVFFSFIRSEKVDDCFNLIKRWLDWAEECKYIYEYAKYFLTD